MTFFQTTTIKIIQALRLVRSYILISQFGSLSRCRYSETCGQYLVRQVKQLGVLPGLGVGLKRMASCQGLL